MSGDIRHILVVILLALAVLLLWLCSIGIMRGSPFNRLHFLGTASIVDPILITLAVFCRARPVGLGQATWNKLAYIGTKNCHVVT